MQIVLFIYIYVMCEASNLSIYCNDPLLFWIIVFIAIIAIVLFLVFR